MLVLVKELVCETGTGSCSTGNSSLYDRSVHFKGLKSINPEIQLLCSQIVAAGLGDAGCTKEPFTRRHRGDMSPQQRIQNILIVQAASTGH